MSKEYVKQPVTMTKFGRYGLTQIVGESTRNLTWAVRDGNPRLTVYLDKEVKGLDGKLDYNKIIIGRFTPFEFYDTIKKWVKILKKGEADYEEVESLYPKMENGKATSEKEITSICRFGLDENLNPYIYVEEDKKLKTKFNLVTLTAWHRKRTKNNPEYRLDTVRNIDIAIEYAEALLDDVKKIVKEHTVKTTVLEPN